MIIDFKKNIPALSCVIAILVVFLFSLFMYHKNAQGKRYVFIFPSVEENQYVLETRYLRENPVKDNLSYFADELLLGSGLERTKHLFTPGARVLSCFERNHVLYVNLSQDLLQMGDGVIEIREGTELLKKNIMKNFSEIDSVEIFIEGKSAFEK